MSTRLPKKSESQADFIVPDPGVYLVELAEVGEAQPSSFDADKLRVLLKFRICDGDEFDGVTVNQWYGLSMHEKSRLFPVVKALNGGVEPDEDADYDLEDFLGKRMMATIDVVSKQRKDNPRELATFANIVAASPVKKKKPTTTVGGNKDLAAMKRRRAQQDPDDDDGDTWSTE